MGNLIATTASIFVPLVNTLFIVPYIFHPDRWGTIPWHPPNWVILTLVTFFLNIFALILLGTLSGMMTTRNKCNKISVTRSLIRSLWLITGWLIGNLLLMVMPFIKAPLLAVGLWLPYAGWIIHGVMVSFFVLFFGAIGNSLLRKEVC